MPRLKSLARETSHSHSKSIISEFQNFAMPLAGIELRYLVNEISEKTSEYYVSNIYSITRDSILFKLHHPEKPDVFLMITTFGMWTSTVKIDKIEQNRLIKRLRNDLLRLKITKIEQLEAERIAYLTFSGFDKEFILVGEFFGDGNIILCNKDMKILALLHSIDVRHRKLNVGLQYLPPPNNALNIFEISKNDLENIKSSDATSAKWLGRTLGLPSKYVEEIFRIAKIDSKKLGNTFNDDDIEKIYDAITKLVNDVISGNHNPVIIKTEKSLDVLPILIGDDTQIDSKVSTFIEGLDKIFTQSIIEKGKSIQSSGTDKKIHELQNILEEQEKAINIVTEKSKFISNIANSLLGLVSQGVYSMDDPKISNMLKENNSEIISEKGLTLLKINDEKIKLNLNAPLQTIASNLFNAAKKQSAAIPSIEKLKQKTEKNLSKLQNQSDIDKESVKFSEIRKKNWYERYRWFFTSDGLLAIGGRDSSSNSSIIRKHLEKNDKVFHADIFGSPFFILKDSQSTPAASLNEVAHATVCFSRAWREAMYGLSAYWINPEQVKKSAPSGQFLPKGSFTIDGQRNFVKVSTLRLAIGLIKQKDDYLLCCGPPEPIKNSSICYAIIEPTGSEMVDSAKKIRTEFIKLKEEIVKPISIDEFVRIIPAGKSHIVEVNHGSASDE